MTAACLLSSSSKPSRARRDRQHRFQIEYASAIRNVPAPEMNQSHLTGPVWGSYLQVIGNSLSQSDKCRCYHPRMRRAALIFGFGSASLAIGALSGCSWKELLRPQPNAVANDVALDRALRVSSLTDGDQPFHLILEVSPPARSSSGHGASGESDMFAQIEVFWLNRITYRIVIRSKGFSQIRIVNGRVVEEHDTGSFYPRWIQNFVDALFEPVPSKSILLKVPGSIPVGPTDNACITTQSSDGPEATSDAPRYSDEISLASVCFRDREPRIASGRDYARYVAFDDFASFGQQQIARTLVNVLPANVFVRGRITHLEPLRQSDYPLLKAKEFTLPVQQILTALVLKTHSPFKARFFSCST